MKDQADQENPAGHTADQNKLDPGSGSKLNLDNVAPQKTASFVPAQPLTPPQPLIHMPPPNMQHPNFKAMAFALPPSHFRQLMARDDLVCKDESEIFDCILQYIEKNARESYNSTRSQLLSCIRLDKLSPEKLVAMSKEKNLDPRFQQQVIDALCRKLKAFEL